MKRAEKYPDTSTFVYFNANPHNRIGGDCCVRAISVAMKLPWETVVREMTEIGIKKGYVLNDPKCIELYLQEKKWIKNKQPKKWDNTKYTGKEFCEYLKKTNQTENIIANIGGHHIVAIVNCKIHDIWNSTDRCIGNFWTPGH